MSLFNGSIKRVECDGRRERVGLEWHAAGPVQVCVVRSCERALHTQTVAFEIVSIGRDYAGLIENLERLRPQIGVFGVSLRLTVDRLSDEYLRRRAFGQERISRTA